MIQGIGPAYKKKFESAGVMSVGDLLEKGKTPEGRTAIEEGSGLKGDKILTFVNHADMLRVDGINPDFAELLVAAGVDSPVELATRDAANLTGALGTLNDEKRLAPESPSQDQVASWIDASSKLDKVVSH